MRTDFCSWRTNCSHTCNSTTSSRTVPVLVSSSFSTSTSRVTRCTDASRLVLKTRKSLSTPLFTSLTILPKLSKTWSHSCRRRPPLLNNVNALHSIKSTITLSTTDCVKPKTSWWNLTLEITSAPTSTKSTTRSSTTALSRKLDLPLSDLAKSQRLMTYSPISAITPRTRSSLLKGSADN